MGEKSIEQQSEQPTYNLLTNLEATLDAMAEVEGSAAWKERIQHSAADGEGTLKGALRSLREFVPEAIADEQENALYSIYGIGGSNRWMIMLDGEVQFSQFHASREKTRKAREMGFKIFE